MALLDEHGEPITGVHPQKISIRRAANRNSGDGSQRFIATHENSNGKTESHGILNMKELAQHLEKHLSDETQPPAQKRPAAPPKQIKGFEDEPQRPDPAALLRLGRQ